MNEVDILCRDKKEIKTEPCSVKRGLLHVQTSSTKVRLTSPHRLTWVKTIPFFHIFIFPKVKGF